MKHQGKCAKCGNEIYTVDGDIGTGYVTYSADYLAELGGKLGEIREGDKICYDCCGKEDLRNALETGKWIGYLSEKDNPIPAPDSQLEVVKRQYRAKVYLASNWPGTLNIPIYHAYKTRHNFGGKVTHVWFKLPGDPFVWYGKQIGDFNQILRARRTKKKEF